MMQPGSRVPGLLPPASPRHYRSVCLPVHLSACLSICMPACKSIQADAAVRLSLHSAVRLSVCPSLLPICPPVCPFVRLCLSVCLPISLPAYVSVRPSAYLSYCPCCLSACLSTREMGHTGHTIQRWNHGAACCPVRSVAECGCTRDDRVMNIFINRKVIQ